jgi:hypothetical protein
MKDRIHELEKPKYFTECDGRALGKEMVSELEWDKAVIFEDYFVVGLYMPAHPLLAEVLSL